MTIRALRPDQLVGVPNRVSVNVSQFTPSTQVLSSSEPPPTAVPTQFRAGPPGLSVPELGCAECNRAVKSPNTARKMPVTKKSAPIVARAVIEGEEIFFIGRTFVNSALRFGKMSDRGRLTRPFFLNALQPLKRFFRERFGLLQSGLLVIRSTNSDRDEFI